MITQFLDSLSVFFYESSPYTLLFAMVAGVLTAFTPCSLSTVPLLLAYLGVKAQRNTKTTFNVVFFLTVGFVIASTVLGIVISLTGQMMFIQFNMGYVYGILSILMLLMALQTWGIFQFIPATYLQTKVKDKGWFGAFSIGVLSAVFSSPCSTPVLVAILIGVSQHGNYITGGAHLALYALGHCIIYPIAAFASNWLSSLKRNETAKKYISLMTLLLGTAFLLFSLGLLYLFLSTFTVQ